MLSSHFWEVTDWCHVHIVYKATLECFWVSGLVKYTVRVQGASSATFKVTLTDRDGHCVASSSEPSGVLKVTDVKLWWPYLMHENPGYLYSLEVRLLPVVSRQLMQIKRQDEGEPRGRTCGCVLNVLSVIIQWTLVLMCCESFMFLTPLITLTKYYSEISESELWIIRNSDNENSEI